MDALAVDRGEMDASAPSTERLIRFESVEQFRSRPRFRDKLQPSEYRLVKPVGGYSFNPDSYTVCGLCNCSRVHGLGLVVLLQPIAGGDPVETNIGHCCGNSKFGLAWAELDLELLRASRDWAIKDLATRVLRERAERLTHAKDLRERVRAAQASIAPIRDLLASDRPLQRAFSECVRNDGRMVHHRPLNDDERALYPGQKTLQIPFGVLQGYAALGFDSTVENDLKVSVIAKLWEWQELDLSKVSRSKLDHINLEMRAFSDVTRRASDFVEQAARLLTPSNWSGLRDYCIASGAGIAAKSKVKLTALAGEPPRPY